MKTALLVIDIQQQLVDELPPQRRKDFLATVRDLVERARANHIPLVYVRHGDDELEPETPGWEISPEIAPAFGEPVVEKTFRDAFRNTRLYETLSQLGATHLVVCGMQTEFCVDATIREAERRGYSVTLVEDGTATYDTADLSEAQIQAHVHRVARGRIAAIVPSTKLFTRRGEPS